MRKIEKDKAIAFLESVPVEMFGAEKGSCDAYYEWCLGNDLCIDVVGWEEEFSEKHGREPYSYEYPDEVYAPSWDEVLLAAGISPQEIVDATGINTKCFPEEMCKAYGFEVPRRKDCAETGDRETKRNGK